MIWWKTDRGYFSLKETWWKSKGDFRILGVKACWICEKERRDQRRNLREYSWGYKGRNRWRE